jgi:hypothetical protein
LRCRRAGGRYPIFPQSTDSVNAFDSNLQLSYTQSYTIGWQRKLGQRHGARSPLRRQPSPSGLGDGQHQRDRHQEQRLRETSSGRRRRTCGPTSPPASPRRSRTRARRAPRRCRSSSRSSTALAAGRPATRRRTPARTGPTRRSSGSSPRESESVRVRVVNTTNGFVGNAAFRANALPRGAGELLPRESRRARHERRGVDHDNSAARAPTRYRSSSASACRTA